MGFKSFAKASAPGATLWKDADGNDSPGFTAAYDALGGRSLPGWSNANVPPPPPQQNQPAQQQQSQSPQSAELAAAAAASGSGNKALLGA